MIPQWLWITYYVDWAITAVWLWMEYLDISTTMKNVAKGAVETNPAMKSYVKPGRPWLMVWGKIVNGAWGSIAGIVVFPLGLYTAWRAWSIWQSVRINERVSGRLK